MHLTPAYSCTGHFICFRDGIEMIRLQQPNRRYSRGTGVFHADMVFSCTGSSAGLKFIFLKHLLQLSSAFACTHVVCTTCLPVDNSSRYGYSSLSIANISKRTPQNWLVAISFSIFHLGCHFEGFVIKELLLGKRYFIQLLWYTGKLVSGNKVLRVCVICSVLQSWFQLSHFEKRGW